MAAKRGPSYPSIGLPEAIERARQLYDQDGTALTTTEVAVQAWGYGSLNGTSLRVVAALKHYALMESVGDQLKLTDRATAILLEPADSPDYKDALGEAGWAPSIFQIINTEFAGNLPSDAAIVSYLVRKQGFNEAAAQKLVGALRETIAFVEHSGATVRPERPAAPTSNARGPDERMTGDRESGRPQSHVNQGDTGGSMEFTWPLSGNVTATLTVSRLLDLDDVELLADYFAVARRALIKAAKTQAAAVAASPGAPGPENTPGGTES